MNDFDRFLEFELRQMLDPVVTPPAPGRRRRVKGSPLLTVVPPQVDLVVVVEPMVVTVRPALLLP